MSWTTPGAQAMLQSRGLSLNDEWRDFLTFQIEQKQDRSNQSIASELTPNSPLINR